MIHDENEYTLLRRQQLALPTASEQSRASRIASQMDCNNPNATTDPLIQSKLKKRQKTLNQLHPMIIHYTHEKRFAHYKSSIHKLWQCSFGRTPITETKLIVGTRNHPNLTKELVQRSPCVTNEQKLNKKETKLPADT
ncbi:unnamed protein product [Rotaria sp. Silwood2]|nr:unnamed protein product [Rotaria sp. Silwood2]